MSETAESAAIRARVDRFRGRWLQCRELGGLPISAASRVTPQVSVVVPAHCEEGNVDRLLEEVVAALDGESWELVVVDDGSTDGTWAAIRRVAAADERVVGIRLSRNFGHQRALFCGLHHARGAAVISLDADLQHPPSLIPEMLRAWRDGSYVVHTERLTGAETSWFKRVSSDLYYRVFTLLTGVDMHRGQSDFRLLDRRVLDALLQMEEAELFLRGVVQWVGYDSTTLPYQVRARHSGTSKYTLWKMLRFAAHGVTSFSTLPLRIGIAVGFLTSGLAFAELVFAIAARLYGSVVPGWASLAGLIALLFGINFMLLGFLGIYVGHVFTRVQRRPTYLVQETTTELRDR